MNELILALVDKCDWFLGNTSVDEQFKLPITGHQGIFTTVVLFILETKLMLMFSSGEDS